MGSRNFHIPTINLTINIYTLPSLVLALSSFILLTLVSVFYKEEKRRSKKEQKNAVDGKYIDWVLRHYKIKKKERKGISQKFV